MSETQVAMIQAAVSIAAMIPPKPTGLMANRKEQLVYSVFENAAKAAYRRAAQECFNAAYAKSADVNFEETHETIKSEGLTLRDLMAMCETGYAWGGLTVTE